ncbi:hypothetical protein T492DRAFT_890244, partial [Pavlovales sp. CCMP2436]
DLLKFAWIHLKSDESVSKQCAYVNVCHFIHQYETPSKIILQVYVSLLRTFQPDARPLVRQALDILTPALPRRLPKGNHIYPTWVKWTKKILVEEGHSLPQLIHIWQLVVRHPSLFFASRAQFVPQNTSADNRHLAIDLTALVIKWEQQRQAAAAAAGVGTASTHAGGKRALAEGEGEAEAAKRMRAASGNAAPGATAAPAGGAAEDDFTPSAAIVEIVVNFLIRISLASGQDTGGQAGSGSASATQAAATQKLWPDVNLKLISFEKQLLLVEKQLQQSPEQVQ